MGTRIRTAVAAVSGAHLLPVYAEKKFNSRRIF
jgi:hypothetical protein